MNLLFVNDIPFNPIAGGLERVTDVLAKEFRKRGHTIYYLYGKLTEDKRYLLDYDFPGKLYELPNYGLFDDEDNIIFYRYLQSELLIDRVINQRGLDGWFNAMLQVTTAPLISVMHSPPDCYCRMKLENLPELSAPPFVNAKRFIKRTIPFVFKGYWKQKFRDELRIIYSELANYSSAIVTLSKKDGEILKGLISSDDCGKVYSIGNPNAFSGTYKENTGFKDKVVLYVGRLTRIEKEPLRMLRIWSSLHKKFPEWQLKIVGEGEEKETMKEYVQSHNLNNVSFEGQVEDVTQYYKTASVVCLTSNFEGWGMTLTEGMQYGCVPMTFDNYGAASVIIDDNANGCLVPAFSIKKYASRLSDLMNDEDKRKKMSKAAIEKVKAFSVGTIADQWEELFENCRLSQFI